MKIGVFDSGIGGLSVARAVEQALPQAEVLFVHDSPEHFPYASKLPEEIYGYVKPIIAGLVSQRCDAIVVACNTVSTTLIGRLRQDFDSVPLIAVEPMVKPAAAATKSGVIAVCATPTTLASQRYAWLKKEFASDLRVIEPDCADWSYLIEHSQLNDDKIQGDIAPALDAGADVVVLGCTHYHWIQGRIQALCAGRATVIQPEAAVVAQLKRVLELQP